MLTDESVVVTSVRSVCQSPLAVAARLRRRRARAKRGRLVDTLAMGDVVGTQTNSKVSRTTEEVVRTRCARR